MSCVSFCMLCVGFMSPPSTPSHDTCMQHMRWVRVAVQEGGESHDSFMASLTSHNDSRSLLPADSAFRMVSSIPAQSSEGVYTSTCIQADHALGHCNSASWPTLQHPRQVREWLFQEQHRTHGSGLMYFALAGIAAPLSSQRSMRAAVREEPRSLSVSRLSLSMALHD